MAISLKLRQNISENVVSNARTPSIQSETVGVLENGERGMSYEWFEKRQAECPIALLPLVHFW